MATNKRKFVKLKFTSPKFRKFTTKPGKTSLAVADERAAVHCSESDGITGRASSALLPSLVVGVVKF